MSAGQGLRERKRRAVRESITATARTLFAERGYDAVTVAQIAAAVGVSEKTIYNHFPTKEDLAFAGREEGIARVVDAILQRDAGTSVLDVFRSLTMSVIDQLIVPGDADLLTVARIIRASPALQERLTVGWEAGAHAITEAIAQTCGAASEDLTPAIVARTLWWTHRSIFLRALQALLTDENRAHLGARLRDVAGVAYDQLSEGLGSYGVRT